MKTFFIISNFRFDIIVGSIELLNRENCFQCYLYLGSFTTLIHIIIPINMITKNLGGRTVLLLSGLENKGHDIYKCVN